MVGYDTKIRSSSLSSQSNLQLLISRKLVTSTYNLTSGIEKGQSWLKPSSTTWIMGQNKCSWNHEPTSWNNVSSFKPSREKGQQTAARVQWGCERTGGNLAFRNLWERGSAQPREEKDNQVSILFHHLKDGAQEQALLKKLHRVAKWNILIMCKESKGFPVIVEIL